MDRQIGDRFSADRPVKSSSEDLPGRKSFAQSIATAILERRQQAGSGSETKYPVLLAVGTTRGGHGNLHEGTGGGPRHSVGLRREHHCQPRDPFGRLAGVEHAGAESPAGGSGHAEGASR